MYKTWLAWLGFLCLVIAGVGGVPAALADSYSGGLSSTEGEIGWTGDWDPITINWQVSQNTDGSFHYSYDLVVTCREVSHILLETSMGFAPSDMFNPAGPYNAIEIDTWTPGPGTPDMPDTVYGIKFDDTSGTNIHIAFDSFRMPVWGDFYAKDGTGYALWNAGFTANDTDPTAPPPNGSVDNHILRPDSYIPEPGTMALLLIGLGGVGAWSRRRKDRAKAA